MYKKTNLIFICFWIVILYNSFLLAQKNFTSDYLKTPEIIIPHVDSCAKFWLPTFDYENGGFYENVSRDGTISGYNKTMLGQTRTAYGMVKAFMLTGDTSYLSLADKALRFMYENAWDNNNSGWFNEMNEDGSLVPNGDHNNDKWSFMQHYALLGIAAMYEATNDEYHKNFLDKGRKAVDSLLWDSRTDYAGYYNSANVDWSNPVDKGFTPTADAITTHGLSYYLLTQTPESKQKLLKLADNIVQYLVANMSKFSYGFPESYNSNWEPKLNDTFVFTGHLLKAAWCLTRAYLIEPREEYLIGSTALLDEVLESGYDNIYGGCFSNFNGMTGVKYNNNKEWWQLEQAFTSAIMNYYISNNEAYLSVADETIDFYMNNFNDKIFGEVYTSTTIDGIPNDTRKAHYWKAGYHSIELGYYIYLYTNLLVHQKPVKLYYYFDPKEFKREIKLTPLAIEDEYLSITNITLDGNAYYNYDGNTRVLSLEENIGGLFEITFENQKTTSVKTNYVNNDFYLYNNYPNPFNPSTQIKFRIKNPGNVSLKIYDVLGNEVRSLIDKYHNSGVYSFEWNGENNDGVQLSTGVYFIKLNHNNKYQIVKAMLIK